MKIAINNTFNKPIQSNRIKYSENSLSQKNHELIHQKESPFANQLNFTGSINRLAVKKTNSLEPLIKDLINFEGDGIEFAQHAFNKIKKHFGYEDVMFDNFKIVENCDDSTFGAQFDSRTGDFQIDKKTCVSLSKGEIAGVLRHEFEHFFQFGRMFRSEEIGINKFLQKENLKAIEATNAKAYTLGIEISPTEAQTHADRYYENCKPNMHFWDNIIAKKGIIKKGTVEATQAIQEFEAYMRHPMYINSNDLKKYQGFPKLQETKYYDKHEIGSRDNYRINPLEIGARKEEESFLASYSKLEKKSYTPNKIVSDNMEAFDNLEDLMNTFQQKFKSKHLPDRFKAYVYDDIVSTLLEEKAKKMGLKECIKEANKALKTWSNEDVNARFSAFKLLIDNGDIRLLSRQETDDFTKFVNTLTNQSTQ